MSDTGGGHRASAEAIKAGFKQRYGSAFAVECLDIWTHHTPWPFNALPQSYSFLVGNPALWRISYYGQQPRAVHRATLALSGAAMDAALAACFDAADPDLVVSVHPLMQQVPLSVLARRARRAAADGGAPPAPPPFATVVTDLTTCHNTWFDGRVDACFVPTPECARRAGRMGVPAARVVMHGLPIRPSFGRVPGTKAAVRKRLGMDPALPTVLLVGGGEGMGAMRATVDALAAAPPAAGVQVVAVCGRNAKLKADLERTPWPRSVRVVPTGFVSNMEAWMAAADVVVTKAGPGTIAEAITSGLPLLLNGFIPCQEAGNVPFVVGRGCGSFERDPARAAATLARWLAPAGAADLAAMRAAVARVAAGWEGALERIVDDLAALCRSGRLPEGAAVA
jgi:1,2-diacylglycerol 3-beta-galactosyltransferase